MVSKEKQDDPFPFIVLERNLGAGLRLQLEIRRCILGVPFAPLLVPISGVLAIVGGLSVALGYKARWAAWLLVAFLVPVTGMMHAYWRLSDPAAIHIQQAMFAKNLSMLGAALLITQFGAGRSSIDDLKKDRESAA